MSVALQMEQVWLGLYSLSLSTKRGIHKQIKLDEIDLGFPMILHFDTN